MKLTKTHRLLFIVLLTLPVSLIFSCTKENKVTGPTVTADATIIYTGSEIADGCGWLIKTDADSVFNAPNLATKYQVDKQKVHITYRTLTTTYFCGQISALQNRGITQIAIYTIKVR